MSADELDPGDVFGHGQPEAARIPHRDKLAEVRRELALRRRVYPKWVEAGQLGQAQADRQLAALEAIESDYDIQPWPQTRNLVAAWRPRAESLTVLGVRAPKMHRDELLAVLAFAVEVLREAGLVEPAPPNEEPK